MKRNENAIKIKSSHCAFWNFPFAQLSQEAQCTRSRRDAITSEMMMRKTVHEPRQKKSHPRHLAADFAIWNEALWGWRMKVSQGFVRKFDFHSFG
jgi:hypothetical protein